MNYEETLSFLYNNTPVYEQKGAGAYKPGLQTSIALDEMTGNPHKSYKSIHVAGTNGKGSVCHTLAAVLQSAGFRVGLYTSPHLMDFRERIRVNGQMADKQFVVDFVSRYHKQFEPLHPSFFEITSTMAFSYFKEMEVDYAVIETGLGGRLDSTNIITPILSAITGIGLEHTGLLGNTIEAIASEKAGIIKEGIPVIIGEADTEAVAVIEKIAAERKSLTYTPAGVNPCLEARQDEGGRWILHTKEWGVLSVELEGWAQKNNSLTTLTALKALTDLGIKIPAEAVARGFGRTVELTGLMGRWQRLQELPLVIADTGHNVQAWELIRSQLLAASRRYNSLRIVAGFSSDKDIQGILRLIPEGAVCFYCAARTGRALPAGELAGMGRLAGRPGKTCLSVEQAVAEAVEQARPDDLVFIGGSNFVVAEALPLFSSTVHDNIKQ